MPVLVEGDATTAGVLGPILPSGTHTVATTGEVAGWLARRDDYAVVLGPTVALDDALSAADQVRSAHPATSVVLVRHDLSPDLFAQALQHGIAAVVAADDHVGIGSAINRSRLTWEAIHGPAMREGGREGRVLTVFSPKGGVGKTTMAVNLGLALAEQRAAVCLVDLDLAFGDIAITLQLIPDHTIAEAADAEEHLDFAMLHSLLTKHSPSLMILAAPTHPEGREHISASLVRRVIATLRSNFDYVIIDTPPGFDDQVLSALDETDEVIVVATLDVPTIKNTKVALETLDLLGLLRESRHLVLNRADEEVGLSRANVEDILGMKVSASLPSAIAVASATNHGQPIVQSKPDHPVSKAITALAATLAGDRPLLATPAATAPAKKGLFARVRKQ